MANFSMPGNSDASAMEINFRRDPSVYDGQFSNNGWLQELPKPMTKMTWDNPVHDRSGDGGTHGVEDRRPG